MKGFWTKFLSDGTTEFGPDSLIKAGQASWSRGRQDICRVHFGLVDGDRTCRIEASFGAGDYLLVDRFMTFLSPGGTSDSQYVHRCLSFAITPQHVGRFVRIAYNECDACCSIVRLQLAGHTSEDSLYQVTEQDIGKHLTVTLFANQLSYPDCCWPQIQVE